MYERSRDGVVGERGSPPACSKPLSALDRPLTSFYEVLGMDLGLKGDMSSFHRADLLSPAPRSFFINSKRDACA